MKAYSLDLREKVMAAVERGEMSRQEVARVFGVTYAWIKKLQRQRRERGNIAPLPHGGGQQRRLGEKQLEKLREAVARNPDVTLQKLCERIRGSNHQKVSPPRGSFAHAAGRQIAMRCRNSKLASG